MPGIRAIATLAALLTAGLPSQPQGLVAVVDGRVHAAATAIEGRIYTADGSRPVGIRVVAERGSAAGSGGVEPGGGFSFTLTGEGRGPLSLRVEAGGTLPPRYHPARIRLDSDRIGDEVRLILVPVEWTVRRGIHAGRVVPISIARAFAPACRGCASFFRPGRLPLGADASLPPPTWPAGAFPIRVAFAPAAVPVPARDSIAFWSAVASLEEELGRDLFAPARYLETLPDERGAPEDVILVESDPRLKRVGWGSTISQTGDIFYGAVRVRAPRVFSGRDGPRLAKHELMHALGLGHTCGWRSVMAQVTECAARVADGATPEDAAYFELLVEVRELQRAVGAAGLEAAR